MSAIQLTARAAIHEGKLEEFKLLAAQCMRTVREQDSGTLQYDWFLNKAQTECVVRETYRDSGRSWSTLPISEPRWEQFSQSAGPLRCSALRLPSLSRLPLI